MKALAHVRPATSGLARAWSPLGGPGLSGLVALLAFGACEGGSAPVDEDRDSTTQRYEVAPQLQSITFPLCAPEDPCGIVADVDLSMVACSAEIACHDELMHDPATLERGPTLMTGFSCGFPDGSPAQDALLAFHPRIRCYQTGDLEDPTTWIPAGGIEVAVDVGEHLFFSNVANSDGDMFTNAAQLLRPLKEASQIGTLEEYGFCELEAWGAIVFSSMAEGVKVDPGCVDPGCERYRRDVHVPFAPAVHWRAILRHEISGWNCHTAGLDPLTWVEREVIVSATHDLDAASIKGELPATQDLALVRVETRRYLQPPNQMMEHQSVFLRYAELSDFPMGAQDAAVPMVTRDLWVQAPVDGGPADVAVTWSCAEIDGAGQVQRIGMLVEDRLLHIPLGAIVVHRALGAEPWECDRDPEGACELLDAPEWGLLTPCLLPAAGP